jgi:hypothetical protein
MPVPKVHERVSGDNSHSGLYMFPIWEQA